MAWKLNNTKVVYEDKWMTVSVDDVTTDFGDNLTYSLVHKKPFAVIIPWDGEKFVMVKQYRYPINKYSWEFPMGHMEHNTIEDTAKTELKEETGYSAGEIKLIGSFYTANGFSSQECMVFWLRV